MEMKKSYQVRLSEKTYEKVRRESFKKHKPMMSVIDDAVDFYLKEGK